VNMIRKGRVRWVTKDDASAQARFVAKLFGIAAWISLLYSSISLSISAHSNFATEPVAERQNDHGDGIAGIRWLRIDLGYHPFARGRREGWRTRLIRLQIRF